MTEPIQPNGHDPANPKCHCGQNMPGRLSVLPTPEPTRFYSVTMHEAAPAECREQRVVKAWWDDFFARYMAPMKAQWQAGRQLTCAIVASLPGRQVRFHKADAFHAASETGFELVEESDEKEPDFVTIRAPNVEVSRIVPATRMPTAIGKLRPVS